MSFQQYTVPFRLNAQEAGGSGNYMDAFAKGLKTGYAPRMQSEDLLAKMLTNKIQGVNAKYAEPTTLADLLAKHLTNEYAAKSMPERLNALTLGNEGAALGNQYNRESMPERLLANQLNNQSAGFDIEKKRAMYDFVKKHPSAVVGGAFQQLAAIQEEEDRIRNGGYLQEPIGATQVGDEQEITDEERKQVAPNEYKTNANVQNEAQPQQLPFVYKLFESLKKQQEKQEKQEERKNLTGKSYVPKEENTKEPTIKERIQGKYSNTDQSKLDAIELMKNKVLGIPVSSLKRADMDLSRAKEAYSNNATKLNLQKVKDAEDARYRVIHGKSKQTEIIEQKRAENTSKSLAMRGWQGALPETKRDAIATARGAGIEAVEAEEMLKKGHSLEDSLKSHGWDVDALGYPEKEYLPTTKGITDYNNRIWAGREMSYINRYISKNTGQYASTFMGENPKLIWDSLVGANKDKQIKYLAALSLAPELGNLRLKYTGASNTVYAQKSMMDSSLLNLRNKLPRVPEDVWKGVQNEQEKVLREAFDFSKKSIVSPAKSWLKNKDKEAGEAENKNALSKKDMDAFVDYNKKYPDEFDLEKIKKIAKNKKKSVYEIIKILHE
jgi:hypothetical protein